MDWRKGISILIFFAVANAWSQEVAQNLKKQTFKVCGRKVILELAREPRERNIGLMHRDSVPPGTGMVFSFPGPEPLNFWMRNVPFAIDIGFFDEHGRLINAVTMAGTSPVQTDDALPRYHSNRDATFAVEAVAGFFKGLKVNACRIEPLPAKGH